MRAVAYHSIGRMNNAGLILNFAICSYFWILIYFAIREFFL